MAAVQRLRSECVEAKEALSADTEVSIPVLLPNTSTEVRLTRAEFEAMIRPPLGDSLTAMRRALRSAGVDASGLTAVLLAGGSSRIPLVSQLVSAELGRPVAVDAHPKHGVALGAAQAAAAAATAAPVAAAPIPPPPPPTVVAPVVAAAALVDPPALARLEALDSDPPTSPCRRRRRGDGYEPEDEDEGGRRSRVIPIVAGAIVAAAVIAGAILLLTRDDGDEVDSAGTVTTGATVTTVAAVAPPTDPPAEVTEAPVTAAPPTEETTPATEPPPPPVCPPDDPRVCIELTGIAVTGDSIIVDWTPVNFEPAVDDLHAHFFWSTTRAEEAGTNAADFGAVPGVWELTDERPFVSEDVLLAVATSRRSLRRLRDTRHRGTRRGRPRRLPLPAAARLMLRLRPLRLDDEAEFAAAHRAMEADDFEFGLGYSPGAPWAEYVERVAKQRCGIDLGPGLVPATFLVADVGGQIVGRTSIRHELNEYLTRVGGHIGYGVLAAHRRRGYATEILRQSLVIARAVGVERALVTCDEGNIGSAPSDRAVRRRVRIVRRHRRRHAAEAALLDRLRMLRRAIVVPVLPEVGALVNEIRERFDPVMAARIDPHITLVHEVWITTGPTSSSRQSRPELRSRCSSPAPSCGGRRATASSSMSMIPTACSARCTRRCATSRHPAGHVSSTARTSRSSTAVR